MHQLPCTHLSLPSLPFTILQPGAHASLYCTHLRVVVLQPCHDKCGGTHGLQHGQHTVGHVGLRAWRRGV